MRIPPSAPRVAPPRPPVPPAPPTPTPPSVAAPAPATVARLLALEAQRDGVDVLLGRDGASAAPAASASPTSAPAADPARAAGSVAPPSFADSAAGSRVDADALASGAVGARDVDGVDAMRATDARVRLAPDAAAPTDASAARAPLARAADVATRLDPATWLPASLHAPLLQRLHAHHAGRAATLPHPLHPATRAQLRALGRWLAERGEVATGDAELVRLARALRLDRRLVRVAAATLLLAALVFALT